MAIAAAARCVFLTFLHPLNWDEIEFFRATDWISRGLVPYRDFWEHHTPLQWFLYAPVASLTHSPGAAAVIAMRWAQVFLWIAGLWIASVWMRRLGFSAVARWSAILLLLCSSLFMEGAVEYRVDTLGCVLFLLAMLLLLDADRSFRMAAAAGGVLCLAAFANLRLGPLIALTALTIRIVRPNERVWGGSSRANGVFAGAAAVFAAAAVYFVATHSAAAAFHHLWTENFYGDRLSEGGTWVFFRWTVWPLGFRLFGQARAFDLLLFDPATVAIFAIGAVGMVRVLTTRARTPDHRFVLAFLQIGNVLFIAAMKFIYGYHFEIVMLLMLPFVAQEIERWAAAERRWAAVAALLCFVSAVNCFASIFRGQERDLRYQDQVMRDVDRLTPPDGTVFDGVGWALRRAPAYRRWFLPVRVAYLERSGMFEPYSPRQMAGAPPAAVITDWRMVHWLDIHPDLLAFATKEYLPFRVNLWLPGLSARLTPAAPAAEWIVPESGEYRIDASETLSHHPWFASPLLFGSFPSAHTEIALRGFPPASSLPLSWTVDGTPIPPRDTLSLRRHQRVGVRFHGSRPLGVMVVPVSIDALFQQPPPGVSLDAAGAAVTHVPRF